MTQNNVKIAITGGIGSGKSTVAEIIAKQGYTVISCDEIYKKLLCDKDFLKKLSIEFGDILSDGGELNRKKLSSIVFSDETKLKKLNEITHPTIMEKALNQMSVEGIFFCEVPLLFEGGYEHLFDKVIVILRERSSRMSAVVKRDNLSTEKVNSRINKQFNYDNQEFEEYYVIHNDGNLTDLNAETLKILQKINKEYAYLA